MKDTNKKIKPGEKKNVHTTTKSYTFKTRVITIFVHSAAATRKQKQTDAAGRDEPSKGCGEERQLLTRHEPVSH